MIQRLMVVMLSLMDNYDYGYAIGKMQQNGLMRTLKMVKSATQHRRTTRPLTFSSFVNPDTLTLNELCGGKVNWVAEALGGHTTNGVTAGENWLQMGIDINLVVGINDAGCLGVYEAFNAADYRR